jgi:glutamyl/glutaminyl-tRNA synthetase
METRKSSQSAPAPTEKQKASKFSAIAPSYRGRLAPSPTGYLHAGHARTFWTAQERAQAARGALVLRNEDLDPSRSRSQFVEAMLEDLAWFGFRWQEGPDVGGAFAPYSQSERMDSYRAGFEKLRQQNCVYPCYCSRHDVMRALQAPHPGEEEPIYPGTCRLSADGAKRKGSRPPSWRFQVPDGEVIEFQDTALGPQRFIAGRDFGDFVVWRHDDVPSYQLAVVLDDAAMRITEVVRGEDLLVSTARQLLLYRALSLEAPTFYHCPLMTNEDGQRLAKRDDALSLRALRQQGLSPEEIRMRWRQLPVAR